jgi:hypothetical protein
MPKSDRRPGLKERSGGPSSQQPTRSAKRSAADCGCGPSTPCSEAWKNAVNARRTNSDLLSRRRCACAVSWASRASVSLSEITAMERIPSSHIILTPDNRYYTHRWTALFGAGQRFPPTPSTPRLSTGVSRSLFSILLTLAINWPKGAMGQKGSIRGGSGEWDCWMASAWASLC